MKINAVLWDYDGTIVNSVPKNIAITKRILARVAPRLTGDNLPYYLSSESTYHIANHQSKNWQDLYLNYYGMTEAEMIEAGALWTQYQLTDETPVDLFPEIKQTISQINLPQGICSQNSSENISQVLEKNGLSYKFQSIIGYDDIPGDVQKPNPYSGIKCLNQLSDNAGFKTILYIGDHEGDVQFARNIEQQLNSTTKVFVAIVRYSGANPSEWLYQPDFEVEAPEELVEIVDNNISV